MSSLINKKLQGIDLKKSKTNKNLNLKKFILVIFLSLISAFAFRFLIHRFYKFPLTIFNNDFSPKLKIGTKVKVTRIFDKNKILERGTLVYLEYLDKYPILRRIIALPKEKVIIKDAKVYINDNILDTDYEKNAILTYSIKGPKPNKLEEDFTRSYFTKEFLLKDNEYFVLTDNRAGSIDSRILGPIKLEQIKGVVLDN